MQDVGGSPLTGRERVEGRDQVREEEVAEAGNQEPIRGRRLGHFGCGGG